MHEASIAARCLGSMDIDRHYPLKGGGAARNFDLHVLASISVIPVLFASTHTLVVPLHAYINRNTLHEVLLLFYRNDSLR